MVIPAKGGLSAITLDKDDALIGVEMTDGKQELLIGTREGSGYDSLKPRCGIWAGERTGYGEIWLAKKDEAIAMKIPQKDSTILNGHEFGFAKRTTI